MKRRFVKDQYIAEEQVAFFAADNKEKTDAFVYGVTINDVNARLMVIRRAMLARSAGRIGRFRLLLACLRAVFCKGARES